MTDYRLKLINNQKELNGLAAVLSQCAVIALDIETIDWWDRKREKIALIQFAFKIKDSLKITILDTLANLDLEPLRVPLESKDIIKVIHNASFDANKLAAHYKILTAPIFDTMVAARRNGEKKYSLKSQAAFHLNVHLDKTEQRSDWSRRPLELKQLDYAARDAYATILLYEHQLKRNLKGIYQTRAPLSEVQAILPLETLPVQINKQSKSAAPVVQESYDGGKSVQKLNKFPAGISAAAVALLGIISKLPLRYGPEQLAVSVNSESRIGIAGWILDRGLGAESDLDEATAKLLISQLSDLKLIELTSGRRLKTTATGEKLWIELDFLK